MCVVLTKCYNKSANSNAIIPAFVMIILLLKIPVSLSRIDTNYRHIRQIIEEISFYFCTNKIKGLCHRCLIKFIHNLKKLNF